MTITIFKQENYPQELGTGEGYSIARFGCALCCVAALCKYYGRDVTPDSLNLQLVQADGFAANGTKTASGQDNKTLLKWGMIAALFGEIKLEKNLSYPKTPADMGMIDVYLEHHMPVIVGVSFLHNPKDTVPSHYVLIYQKNADGSYQCMDPWFGDSVNFDIRYAVNGMTPGNAILQVVAYSGPVPADTTMDAPIASHPQQAVTPTEIASAQADTNYNLYLQEVALVKQKDDRIQELQDQVVSLQTANGKLTTEIGDTKTLNAALSSQLSKIEQTDSATIEDLQKQVENLREKDAIVRNTADYLRTKPTLPSILGEIDSLQNIVSWAKKLRTPNAAKQTVSSMFHMKEVNQ